ncbi:COG4567 Response regulator consisting of a CheY-like receiver domain and a Fis-type HTH domain [Rhabdaerophilaceae bacterium]
MDSQLSQSFEKRLPLSDKSNPSLLILDDDRAFLARLGRAMETRGYAVTTASSVQEGMAAIAGQAPDFAIIDVRLGDGNGLDVVAEINRRHPDTRALVLTGYGNIASAVSAIKRGAFDYLAKPADADEIDAALHGGSNERAVLPEQLMSADRVRWEHIQRIYEMCDRNVSETARRLHMHRRTLQRILAKRAPR